MQILFGILTVYRLRFAPASLGVDPPNYYKISLAQKENQAFLFFSAELKHVAAPAVEAIILFIAREFFIGDLEKHTFLVTRSSATPNPNQIPAVFSPFPNGDCGSCFCARKVLFGVM